MRIAFMGTPDFAVPTLKALLDAGHDVVAVYSQPPRRAGRGKQERKSPVHTYAEEQGLTVHTPRTLKDADEQGKLAALDLDYAVVVAYGQLLPKPVLDAPKYGCVNVHASLLPRWRGAAPIHRAIMAGDKETGVCIMLMEEGLDTGPVLKRVTIPIGDSDTTLDLHDQLAHIGADCVDEALTGYMRGAITPESQPEDGVTYAKKIDKAEAKIDWSKPAEEIDCMVRGLSPFPGAWCEIEGERVKFLNGRTVEMSGETGTVIDENFTIACGDGAYQPSLIQKAGKSAMDTESFLRGKPLTAGTKLA